MTEPRRSVLFTPGDEPGMMRKSLGSDADVVVFDLEDAVAPEAKEKARSSVTEVLEKTNDEGVPEAWVRTNPLDTGGSEDLRALAGNAEPSCFVVPKAGSASQVEEVADVVEENGSDAGLVPIVETAKGVVNAPKIAGARRVSAVVFGAEDLSADIGATRTDEGTEVLYARQKVVTTASAAGVDALDTLWTDFKDEEGLRRDTERTVRFGYDGKLAIHPTQVPVINDTFTPEEERIEWAEKIMREKREADERGKGVFEVDGEMVDEPLVEQARTVLERAEAAGLTE